MRALIVLDHPYPGSFTHALVAAARRGLARAGHDIDLIDLHADGFDPVTHVADLAAWRHGETADERTADYQRRLVAADHLVLAFPIWWEVAPAMMKGFVDKTVGKGVAYDQSKPGGRMRPRLDNLQGVTMMTPWRPPPCSTGSCSATPWSKRCSEARSARSASDT
jgi:putative NADPH-quinone reductase